MPGRLRNDMRAGAGAARPAGTRRHAMKDGLMSSRTPERLFGEGAPTADPRDAAAEWPALPEAGKLGVEKAARPRLVRIIPERCPAVASAVREQGDAGLRCAPEEKAAACLEAGDTSAAGLFAPLRRAKMGRRSPTRRARGGMEGSGAECGARGGRGRTRRIAAGLGNARRRMLGTGTIGGHPARPVGSPPSSQRA